MGCSPGDSDCRDNENLVHPVTITKGFWMGRTAVTMGAWKKYGGDTKKPPLGTSDQTGRQNLNEASGNDAMPVVLETHLWDQRVRWGRPGSPTPVLIPIVAF
jgi:formylglycine-generating enzyme required for sulfatase activity